MKRILMLNYEFPPLGGGAANANLNILKQFSKNKDIKIDLITSSKNKYKIKKFSKNIKIYYLNIHKNNKNLQSQSFKDLIIYSLKSFLFAVKLKTKKKYDICHAWFATPSGIIATLLRIPYIISLRGSDVPGHNPQMNNVHKVLMPFTKLSWKRSKLLIANSQNLKDIAKKVKIKKKIDIIPNGVDCHTFQPTKTKIIKGQFLFVGRLNKIKNIDKILIAMSKVPKSKLLIAGDGPDKNNLIQMAKRLNIEKKVRFLGQVNKSELIEYYNSSEALVLLSKNEGMSNAILEGLACGLPIICSDTGGSEKLVKGNGFIVNPNNNEEIQKTLSKKFTKSMREKSRKIALDYSWKMVAKEYFKRYKLVRN